MDEQVAKLVARLEADVSDFKRGMNQADSQIKKTSQGTKDLAQSGGFAQSAISALGGVMIGVFSVATVRKIAAVGLELNSIRIEAENVTNVFSSMYRDSAGGIAQLRAATSGVVSDLQLMKSASLLASTELADNVGEAAHIMQNAMLLGTSFGGTTATQALESILPTLTNQSALRLDMFGMSGDQVQKLQDQYEAAGMASGKAFAQAFLDVSDELLVNANLIDPVTGTITAQEDATTGLSAAWDNAKTALARYLEISGAIEWASGFIQDTADMINETASAYNIINNYVDKLQEAYSSGFIDRKQLYEAYNQIEALRGSIELGNADAQDFVALASGGVDNITNSVKGLAGGLQALDAKTSAWSASIQTVDAAIDETQLRLEILEGKKYLINLEIQTTFSETAAAIAEEGAIAAMRYRMQQINAEYEQKVAAGMTELFGPDYLNTTPAEKGYWDAETDALSSSNSEYESLLQERQQMLENYASSALTLTSVTDRDWWETNLGEYNDKPDEYIRRLNAALNDANSEWAWMLGGRTGDAAQLYVAQQSDLWTSGQWGGLGPGFEADKSRSAIIDSIRQNVTAQRAREALIQSIITDPALADIGLTASEIAGITGDTDTLAEGVASSLATTNIASIVTNSFGDQLQAEEQVWVSYGELIVTWLKVGMSNNNQMASGLAELLFPELQEMFEGRQ